MGDVRKDFAGVFERLERASPEQRAELFYRFEGRWCWDCGGECGEDGHQTCEEPRPADRLARLEAVEADRDRYRDTMRASLQRVTDLLAAAPLDYWLISERKAAVSEARAILAAHAVLAPDTKDDPDPHGIRAAVDMLMGDGGDDAA